MRQKLYETEIEAKRAATISKPEKKSCTSALYPLRQPNISRWFFHARAAMHTRIFTHTNARCIVAASTSCARYEGDRCVRADAVRRYVRVHRCGGGSLRGRSLCVGLECVLGRSALTFRRGRAMVSRLLLRAG